MKMNALVILIATGLCVAHSLKHDLNTVGSKHEQKRYQMQTTVPSIVESTTGMTHTDSFHGFEEKNQKSPSPSFFPQPSDSPMTYNSDHKPRQDMFQSNAPFPRSDTPFRGQDQFYSRGEPMFEDRKTDRPMFGDNQNAPEYYGNQPEGPNFYSQQEQREFFSGPRSMSPEQQMMNDGARAQSGVTVSGRRQPYGNQFYRNNQIDLSDKGLKGQFASDKQSMAVQEKGVSLFGARKLLPFQPRSSMALGMSHPILPSLVYSTNPSSLPVAIGRGTFRQHLQTPYVRYVYSHLL